MTVHVYHYPACSTCRKALAWFAVHGVPHEKTDIVKHPPSVAELQRILEKSGLSVKKLFNTSGEVYRQQGYKDKLASMSVEEALEALSAQGKLIKRPIVIDEDGAIVGFDEAAYAARWG